MGQCSLLFKMIDSDSEDGITVVDSGDLRQKKIWNLQWELQLFGNLFGFFFSLL